MSAFFLATISKVKDAEKFGEYARRAGESFAPYGANLVTKGKFDKSLAGEFNTGAVSIVRFPDIDALNSWFASEAYQAIVPLRDEAAELTISAFHEVV